MSERGYFNYRYALPGYTFIMIILLINLRFIMLTYLKKPDVMNFVDVFIGFIFLLSGSALGFLLSQIWHIINNYIFRCNRQLMRRQHFNLLKDIFIDYPNVRADKIDWEVIVNYVLTTQIDENIMTYIDRRRDLVNTLASTAISIFMALISGCYIKTYILKTDPSLETLVIWHNFDFIMVVSSIVMILILIRNAHKILKGSISMCALAIFRARARIKNHFSEEYFKYNSTKKLA